MVDFYRTLCEKTNIPKDAVECALGFYEKSDFEELSRLFFDESGEYSVFPSGVLCYKDAFFPYRFFSALAKKSADLGVSNDEGCLYAYILLSKAGLEDHLTRGLDENIYFDTLKTVANACRTYYKDRGCYGLYDYHFLSNHTRGNILRLGSFEYVLSDYNSVPSIILHIPDRADFSKNARHSSYAHARRYFGEDRPIIADTWLLYGELINILPKGSNIISFFDDFSHITQNKESFDYSELFHVFGRLDDYSYDNLPKNTVLQKAFAERIRRKLPIGSGVGRLKF